ncbi:MAG: DUF123 domain-containing protein [Anaerolineae bacterium]
MRLKSSIMGTYVLALVLDTPRRLAVGRLGVFEFPPGWYLYVGSARGGGGLAARLARHRRHLGTEKRAHWHIDYVREAASWGGAWIRPSRMSLECEWAQLLYALPGATVTASRFGASDCRCPGHLVRVDSLPGDEWFASTLGAVRVTMGEGWMDNLLEILGSGDEDSRETAAVALGAYGAGAAEPLAGLLAADDVDTRWWAVRALAETGGPRAVALAVDALTDADPDVRACAALVLGRIGDAEAAEPLASCLTDNSAFVAGVATDALAMMGEPAVAALVEMLADAKPHARVLAVRALERIKSPEAIGPLYEVLDDPSYLVRYHAQEALEALGAGMVFMAP